MDRVSSVEAAGMLGISRGHVNKQCQRGVLDGEKRDGLWWVSRESIERYPEYLARWKAEEHIRNRFLARRRRFKPWRRKGHCPRCGIKTDGGLCADCEREQAGQGCRWYPVALVRSSWRCEDGTQGI